MDWKNSGVLAALGAALLFGASTPFAKLLLGSTSPWVAAGLLYMGSGLGLAAYRWITRAPSVRLTRSDLGWLGGAILAGGVVAPVVLLYGLSRMPASGASLLLNAEGVLTALLAWFVFRENVDRRVALGMVLIVAGAVVLSWPGEASFGEVLPSLAVCAACLGWAIDNNLTRKVSLTDATFVSMAKGLIAGAVNLLLGLLIGAAFPRTVIILGAGVVGLLGYGVSLTLFVIALRHLGTARTGAYFSTAPFAGAPGPGAGPAGSLPRRGAAPAGGEAAHPVGLGKRPGPPPAAAAAAAAPGGERHQARHQPFGPGGQARHLLCEGGGLRATGGGEHRCAPEGLAGPGRGAGQPGGALGAVVRGLRNVHARPRG